MTDSQWQLRSVVLGFLATPLSFADFPLTDDEVQAAMMFGNASWCASTCYPNPLSIMVLGDSTACVNAALLYDSGSEQWLWTSVEVLLQ